jgi:hypothetical protein
VGAIISVYFSVIKRCFLINKSVDYNKIYEQFIEKARNRTLFEDGKVIHRHHIIPRAAGGDDSPDNLVGVTFREHVFCHLVLAKIYPDNSGVLAAAKSMAGQLSSIRRGTKKGYWVNKKISHRDKAILEKIAACRPYSPYDLYMRT